MNTRKWLIASSVTALVFLAMLALAAGLTRAQEPAPPEGGGDRQGSEVVDEAAAVGASIPIQGRLTDASGNPIDGTRSITFTLYNQLVGGTALCQDNDNVYVYDGLFTGYIDNCDSSDIYGDRLYLGIQVEGDEEMSPRRAIYPVPYAFSLRPGARIRDTSSDSILKVDNLGSGNGVTAHSDSGAGVRADAVTGDGVYATSLWGDGVFGISADGRGVVGSSASGAAIAARGTGIITSTAKSYVWISGSDLRKRNSTDTTQFECDIYGGVKVTRGADPGMKDVILPVTLPGQLYGQDVTLTGIEVYFKSQTVPFDTIDATVVRRQTGAGSGDLIRSDETDRYCDPACSYYLALTNNNVLDDEHGVVYIAFRLQFNGPSSYIQIGGVRLTLEHD